MGRIFFVVESSHYSMGKARYEPRLRKAAAQDSGHGRGSLAQEWIARVRVHVPSHMLQSHTCIRRFPLH